MAAPPVLAGEHKFEGPAQALSMEERNCVVAELVNVLDSHHFKGSRRCSEFLDYIVRQTLKENPALLKERSLGMALFDRPANYDTNSDPVVRATAGEVRKKLAQYYQNSKQGLVRISLPVGTYVPRFEVCEPTMDGDSELTLPHPPSRNDLTQATADELQVSTHRRWLDRPRVVIALSAAGAILAIVGIYATIAHLDAIRAAIIPKSPDAAMKTFWTPFLSPQTETVAVFSEVSRRSQQEPMSSGSTPIGLSLGNLASPGVSGVGEVMGVHQLDGVFNSFEHPLRVKRSNFFTFDDAINENVIFLGSPLANPPLRVLQSNRDFVFQIVQNDTGEPTLAIVNNRPSAGEPARFFATPNSLPIKSDYAVIAMLPGLRPGGRVLVLAGITTFGTQAAAEFVSRNDSVKTLVSHLKKSRDGELEPFEAVISVKIDGEVPLEESLVAVHPK